jgi:hypothetical protein
MILLNTWPDKRRRKRVGGKERRYHGQINHVTTILVSGLKAIELRIYRALIPSSFFSFEFQATN